MTDFPHPPLREPTPLVLSGVSKRFGDFTAVDDVSLEVRPGEIFALLGPNGAGKTTLISCIAGLARASAGRISVFGYDVIDDFRATRRLLGLVPQEINFDPFFTPHESLMIQMGLMGVPPDAAWADELLALMSLSDKRDAYTRSLSGGMKRRLLVAKALVHRPRLLFLDEPTAGVDVELRKELWDVVRGLLDDGTTVILTTHYLEEAEELADRIGVLHKGELVVVEDRDTLMQRHGSQVVRVRMEREVAVDAVPDGWEQADDFTLEAAWNGAGDLARALDAADALGEVVDVSVGRTRLEDIFVDLIHQAEARREADGSDR